MRSVRVGEADDPATMMAPLIAPPAGPLLRGLTELDAGRALARRAAERPGWRRREVDARGEEEITSRRWTPGVRVGVTEGSWFHQTECFGPVLGVMRADDLAHAVRLQNGTPFGLTGGIQSLDDDEIRYWLDHVEVGNAYVNRHITGAIVQRQPFGGWKRSSIGGAPKAGGPHYVHALLRAGGRTGRRPAAATASYRAAWEQHFATGHDATGLRSESNVLRHVPVAGVVVRVGADTPSGARRPPSPRHSSAGWRPSCRTPATSRDEQLAARLGSLGVDATARAHAGDRRRAGRRLPRARHRRRPLTGERRRDARAAALAARAGDQPDDAPLRQRPRQPPRDVTRPPVTTRQRQRRHGDVGGEQRSARTEYHCRMGEHRCRPGRVSDSARTALAMTAPSWLGRRYGINTRGLPSTLAPVYQDSARGIQRHVADLR